MRGARGIVEHALRRVAWGTGPATHEGLQVLPGRRLQTWGGSPGRESRKPPGWMGGHVQGAERGYHARTHFT